MASVFPSALDVLPTKADGTFLGGAEVTLSNDATEAVQKNMLADQNRVVVVGASATYQTITQGISAASLLTPSAISPVVILLLSGQHEVIGNTIPQYVSLVGISQGSVTLVPDGGGGISPSMLNLIGDQSISNLTFNRRFDGSNYAERIITASGGGNIALDTITNIATIADINTALIVMSNLSNGFVMRNCKLLTDSITGGIISVIEFDSFFDASLRITISNNEIRSSAGAIQGINLKIGGILTTLPVISYNTINTTGFTVGDSGAFGDSARIYLNALGTAIDASITSTVVGSLVVDPDV